MDKDFLKDLDEYRVPDVYFHRIMEMFKVLDDGLDFRVRCGEPLDDQYRHYLALTQCVKDFEDDVMLLFGSINVFKFRLRLIGDMVEDAMLESVANSHDDGSVLFDSPWKDIPPKVVDPHDVVEIRLEKVVCSDVKHNAFDGAVKIETTNKEFGFPLNTEVHLAKEMFQNGALPVTIEMLCGMTCKAGDAPYVDFGRPYPEGYHNFLVPDNITCDACRKVVADIQSSVVGSPP